jgi:hypothetical protein
MAPLSSPARRDDGAPAFPVVVLVPLLPGAVRLYGQRAATTTRFGTAIFALAVIVVFTGVVWQRAVVLNGTAPARRGAVRAAEGARRLADFVGMRRSGCAAAADGTILWPTARASDSRHAREDYVG